MPAQRLILAIAALAGCSSAPEAARAPDVSPPLASAAVDAAPPPGSPPVGETEARVVLAGLFREAGYRIRYDVAVVIGRETVAVDGYDPDRAIGFEYIAPEEAETWKVEEGGAAPGLLVVAAADRETLEARARAFLAEIGPAQ
jgi:hypothetical protein